MLINQFSENFSCVLEMLPIRVREGVERCADTIKDFERKVNEIRLRAGRSSSLTLDGKNLELAVTCTQSELAQTVKRFCGGSVYAHSETLKAGYISLAGGYRVGVAGRAVLDNGTLTGVGEIYSINIRIPHSLSGVGKYAYDVLSKMCFNEGILIYSRPGVGKTTMLRDIARRLSIGENARRVVLVDSRGELDSPYLRDGCFVDVLSGYPKAAGIEIATRTLSPQFIICDEIGALEEARAILAVQSSGVPLIASAHASCIKELLLRPTLALLHQSRIFGAYLGIDRVPGQSEFKYELTYRDEGA